MKQVLAAASVIALLSAVQGGLVKAEPLDAKTDGGGNTASLVLAESGDAPAASLVRGAMAMAPAPRKTVEAVGPDRLANADVFTKLLMLATMSGAEPVAFLAITGR